MWKVPTGVLSCLPLLANRRESHVGKGDGDPFNNNHQTFLRYKQLAEKLAGAYGMNTPCVIYDKL
jgi:hypothetical protein